MTNESHDVCFFHKPMTYDAEVTVCPSTLKINLKFRLVKQITPRNVSRLEDYCIYNTKADKISLNRYKVVN